MSIRRYGRRPNRRQVSTAILSDSLLVLQVHGEVIDAGDTIIQVDVLTTAPVLPDLGPGPPADDIRLTGLIDGVFGSTPCIAVTNGGPTGLGQGMTLRFAGVLDLTAPYQVEIPAALLAVKSSFRGNVSGTLQSDQINSAAVGGYVRLTNLGVVGIPLPLLCWVVGAVADGSDTVIVTVTNDGGGPFVFDGIPNILSNGGPQSIAVGDLGSPAISVQFNGMVNPGDVLTMAWPQTAVRGSNGSYLAPFSFATTA